MASVKRRPDGKWRARYRGPDRVEHARHFARKVDAEQWLVSVQSSVQRGEYVDHAAGRQTVRAYFGTWSSRQLWTRGTLESYRSTLRTLAFADVPIASVRPSHVEGWVKGLSASGLAPATVRTRVKHVSALFEAATRDRIVVHNPTKRIALPRERRREARMVIPTAEHVGALVDAMDPRMQALIALCAFAGLRIAEACAIRVEDIDFMRRKIIVRRQRRPGGEIALPKYGGEREVFASDSLLTMLARHLEIHGHGSDGSLFIGKDGPMSTGGVRKHWRVALRCVPGNTTAVRVHDLRHFYASGLIAAGCDVVTVQRALGHASATVTLNTYSHLWPTAADTTRAAAEALFSSARGLSADQDAISR